MTESDSPTEAWKTMNVWFNPQTTGREINLFSDLVNVDMPADGSPISPYAKVTNVTFRMSAGVNDPAVVPYIGGNLQAEHEIALYLPTSYEGETRALRVDAPKEDKDSAHAKRVISDRYQFVQRRRKRPENKHHHDSKSLGTTAHVSYLDLSETGDSVSSAPFFQVQAEMLVDRRHHPHDRNRYRRKMDLWLGPY